MTRPGGKDRGLFVRKLPSGKEVWCVRFSWQGRDIKLKGGTTKEEARRTLRKTLANLEAGRTSLTPTRGETVAGALDRYKPIAQRNRNYKKTQCFFAFWETHFGKVALTKITPALIEQAQQALLDAKKSPATVNRYMDFSRHVLNREVRLGHLHTNPFTRVSRLREPDAPIYQYSHDQEKKLMAALGDYGAWVRLAILTGLRQSEQFSIRKEWIHWSEGYMQIPTSKTGKPRIVLLTDEIAKLLRVIGNQYPLNPWLFPSPRDPATHRDPGAFYRRIFRPACKAASIPLELKWHQLKHTFGSRLAALGVSAHQIKALGGWTTDRAANRYLHLLNADLLKEAEKLSGPRSETKSQEA